MDYSYDLSIPVDVYPAHLPKPGQGYVKMRIVGNRPGPKGWTCGVLNVWVPNHRMKKICGQIPGWRGCKAKIQTDLTF